MNANEEVEKTLAHQASGWVTVLRGGASREQLAAFAEWIRTSPRHVRDFLTMMAVEKALHEVDPERKYGRHELDEKEPPPRFLPFGRATRQAVSTCTPSPAAHGVKPGWRGRRGWAAAAAFAAVAVLCVWQRDLLTGWRSYATSVGEQRSVELSDGSIVQLNTRSRLKVRISGEARDMRLMAGEALFKVRRDPARPFRVHSGDAVIRALGTEFNVYRRTHGTVVSVLEGRVALAPESVRAAAAGDSSSADAELGPGEEARIEPGGRILKRRNPDPARTLSWRQRRLVFDQDALADMVREFNRYNEKPRFRLEDAQAGLRHYTGVFDANDPESLFQLLSAEPGLAVTREGDEILVRSQY